MQLPGCVFCTGRVFSIAPHPAWCYVGNMQPRGSILFALMTLVACGPTPVEGEGSTLDIGLLQPPDVGGDPVGETSGGETSGGGSAGGTGGPAEPAEPAEPAGPPEPLPEPDPEPEVDVGEPDPGPPPEPPEPTEPPGPPCDADQACPSGYQCDAFRYTENAWFCAPLEPPDDPCFDTIQTTHGADARGVCVGLNAGWFGPNCQDNRDDPDYTVKACAQDPGAWVFPGTCLEYMETTGYTYLGTSSGKCNERWHTLRIHMFAPQGREYARRYTPGGWWPNPDRCSANLDHCW